MEEETEKIAPAKQKPNMNINRYFCRKQRKLWEYKN